MNPLATVVGIVLVVLVAQDAFETIVLPRRVTRRIRLARLFYRAIYLGWSTVGRRIRSSAGRDAFFGYVGPLSLLALLFFWAVLFVVGFGLALWGLAVPLSAPDTSTDFFTYLYLSGTTFFTLGLGDVAALSGTGRVLIVSEVALGFIFLALVVSYVPVIYQAFSRRELRISLLDSRAGSPPTAVELLRRNCVGKDESELIILLHDWEAWSADILESHLSYPILSYYRSQHEKQSWVGALTVILDTCALILTSLDVPRAPARFTFAIARHTVVDLAQVLGTAPRTKVNRLPSADFANLQALLEKAGLHVRKGADVEQALAELRATYEPFVSVLAERVFVSLPPWIPPIENLDSWQTSEWDDTFPRFHQTLDKVMLSK